MYELDALVQDSHLSHFFSSSLLWTAFQRGEWHAILNALSLTRAFRFRGKVEVVQNILVVDLVE